MYTNIWVNCREPERRNMILNFGVGMLPIIGAFILDIVFGFVMVFVGAWLDEWSLRKVMTTYPELNVNNLYSEKDEKGSGGDGAGDSEDEKKKDINIGNQ